MGAQTSKLKSKFSRKEQDDETRTLCMVYEVNEDKDEMQDTFTRDADQNMDNAQSSSSSVVSGSENQVFQPSGSQTPDDMEAPCVLHSTDVEMIDVKFYLYVEIKAEEVTIELEHSGNSNDRALTKSKLMKMEGENCWSLKMQLRSDEKNSLKYNYLVKPKALQTESRDANTLEPVVFDQENQPRLLASDLNFDVFQKPDEEDFEKQFLFVKMFYTKIRDDGRNLEEVIKECKAVGFYHWKHDEKKNKTFLEWIEEVVKNETFSPFKSAFICTFYGQNMKKDISRHKTKLSLGKETVNILLSKLRDCPTYLLPSDLRNNLKSIGYYLLDADSSVICFEYIFHFGRLYEVHDLLRVVRNIRNVQGPPSEAAFDSIVNDIASSSWWNNLIKEDKIKILELLIKDVPSFESAIKLYENNIEMLSTSSELHGAAVSKLKDFKIQNINSAKYYLNRLPVILKTGFANQVCESTICQVQRRESFDLARDLLLDNKFQKLASTNLIKLLKHLTSSADVQCLEVVCNVFEDEGFDNFFDRQDGKTKEEVVKKFLLNKFKARTNKGSTTKENVVSAFHVVQEVTGIRMMKNSKELIETVSKVVIRDVQDPKLRLIDILEAYDDIRESSGEIAKECCIELLTTAMESKKFVEPDVMTEVIDRLFSHQASHSSFPSIDGKRERILLVFIQQNKLPSKEKPVFKLLPMKIWRVVFQVSGKVDRLHQHPFYIFIKCAITWLCGSKEIGQIPTDFLKDLEDQKVVEEFSALARSCLNSNDSLNPTIHKDWGKILDCLSEKRGVLIEHFDILERANFFVDQIISDLLSLNLADIKQECNDRKDLYKLLLSRLFLNFARSIIEEAMPKEKLKTDEEFYSKSLVNESRGDLRNGVENDLSIVEELFGLLIAEGIPKFTELFEEIFDNKGQNSSPLVLDRLLRDVEEQLIEQEFKLVCEFFGKPYSSEIWQMLKNYIKYESVKERILVVIRCLHSLGYKSESEGPHPLLSIFEKFVKCKESGTLASISSQVDNEDIRRVEKSDESLVDILNEISQAKELMEFIVKTAKDDMTCLVDAVEEYSDQHFQGFTVPDFIDVHRFLSELLGQKPDDPVTFLDCIASIYTQLATKSKMASKIKFYSYNVHSLRGLYMSLSNRGQMTKERIKSILREGCYHIEAEKGGSFQVRVTYASENKKSKTEYHMEGLNDLRSRALLFVNAYKSDRTHVEQKTSSLTSDEQYQFIDQVDLITEITRKYEALRRSGIPKYKGSFWTKLQSSDEIKQEEAKVEKELTDWNSMLHFLRKQYFFLNYFHATQLWELTSFFQNTQLKKEMSDKVLAMFRCIDSRVTKQDLPSFQTKYKHPTKTDIQSELRAVGTALEEIFDSSQQKPLPIIASPKKTEALVEPGKLYVGVLEPGSSQTVHVIMALFLNTCASLPKPSQLLFCHSKTTWEEIELFLFRTFPAQDRDKTGNLHCLANVESLPNDIQFQLVNKLIRKMEEVKSPYLLAVICRGGSHHHIADQFGERTHYFGGMPDSELRETFVQECPNTFFVTSDLPGLGKSEEICSHAAEVGKSIVTFPISGPFSRKYLVGRLCGLQVKTFHALHFDIGEVDDPSELDTFLFELIVTGMVSSEAQLFSLPTNHIYIEIANTLQHRMQDSLPICKCFQKLVVKWKECRNLISSKELTSPVQVVCQYLKAYDSGTLESQEIVLSGPNKVQPLDSSMCGTLLSKHFFSGEDLSFNVLENFIYVLANQLMQFSRSLFLKPESLEYMIGRAHDVRVRLFIALLEVATSFAARSVSTCKATQSEALTERRAKGAFPTSREGTTAAEMVKRVRGMIHWADNEHFVIMLHGDGTVTAIYRDIEKLPQGVIHLFKSQSIRGKGLEDYKTMSQEELQERLERISNAAEGHHRAELQSSGYALTPDNILKMALIIQRIQANIPVILMGETGCGKTSLVEYLAATCETPFCVFNFHAGITEKEITSFIFSQDKEARYLQKQNKSLWVFLDEINTCDYLGTINEIVCHRSLHGKPLAPNLVFVATCNPYRLRPAGEIMTAGLEGKTTLDEYSKLVYRVHPLPETMNDYVWDYGSLSKEDEKAYIVRMVEGLLDGKDCKLLVELLAASQEFVRQEDQSSFCVSLRDVHRATILIKWFKEILKMCPRLDKDKVPENIQGYLNKAENFKIEDRCIVLALAHCYLSRLPSASLRKKYCINMSNVFSQNERGNCDSDAFENIVRAQQEDWLLRMELPQGTARNAALRENVFVLLVCILNRMPVFVVGKPGSSKSLSMQVIRSNLRGQDSKDPFLKTLPQLFVVSFQGSESSTSEGIEKVFEKARKYKNEAENVLPVVLLDEIGLAEVSKFNPLKVLHRLLEPSKGQFPDVAVVGISNWALDAAKMNRAVHLSRPEPDEDDLYETGLSIREAQMDKPSSSKTLNEEVCNMLKCLAKAYHQYQSRKKLGSFHGLRDYYSMVKCLEISESKPENHNRKLQKAMQRNFGGISRGESKFQKMFLEELKKRHISQNVLQFPVAELIRDNLYDSLARHLMIITNGDSAIGILDQTLRDLNKEKITIFGSRFEEDLSADYNHRVLSRIILYMEQNCVLILRDLEGIYGSLYDMLNQNYIVVGGKKNCRIALGPFSNPMCQVDDGFRCIVLVDENKVDYSDPPFLNRFEKQLLRFSDVLDAKQEEMIKELREWVTKISTVRGHEKEFSEVDMFAGFHEDTLLSLVLFHSQDQHEIDKRDVVARCKDDLMFVATPDAVIRSRKSYLYNSNEEDVNTLYQDYFEKPIHHGLKAFLQHYLDNQDKHPKSMKLFVMTHSSIHSDVSKYVEGVFDVQTEKLSFFKSEKEFSKRVQYFWKESSANFLAIQCRPDSDAAHMLLVKSIIEQQQKEYIDSLQGSKCQKHVCIVIHLRREAAIEEDQRTYRWQFNFLSGWRQVMIDVLERPVIQIKEILESSIVNVLDSENMSFNKVAEDQLLWCFTRIKYPPSKQPTIHDTRNLVQIITTSCTIMDCLKKFCCVWIENNQKDSESWIVCVACERKMLINCSTLEKAMECFVTHLVRRPLTKVIYFVQRESAWKAMTECEDRAQEVCLKLLSLESIFAMDDIPDPQGAESLPVDVSHLELIFPFSYLFYKRIDCLKEFFLQDYRRQCNVKENLDDQDELTKSAKSSLIVRVSRKVQQVITEMLDSDYLVSHISDYLNDVLDIKSEEFSLRLTRVERIRILKAYFADDMPTITAEETPNATLLITQLHSLFWMNEDTVAPLLHYIQACMPQLQLSIDDIVNTFCEADNESGDNDIKLHDTGDATFETFAVEKICASLFPTDEVVQSTGGIQAWKNVSSYVLSETIVFGVEVKAFYILKVCNDFSSLIPSEPKTLSLKLYALGQCMEVDNHLDSERIFNLTYEFVEDLRNEDGADEEKLEEFLLLFYGRCIESNPDTPLMGEILKQISSTRNERLLQLAVPILYRIFRTEETAFSSEHFGRLLDSPKDLEDFPNLIEVNEALSELQASDIEELDCHFNVICCDLIIKMVFGDLNLKKVSSSNDPVLHNFHKAAEILSSFDEYNDCSVILAFICAVSYLRAFIFHLAKFLFEHGSTLSTGDHDSLLRDIFSDMEKKTLSSRKGSLNFLLIKELRQYLSMYEIRQLVDGFEMLHYLKSYVCSAIASSSQRKISHDPFQSLAAETEVERALCKHKDGSDSSFLEDVLGNVMASKERRMELAAVVFEEFYLVRSIRNLKDTEDEVAKYITDKLGPYPNPYKSFLLRLANRECFKCTELEVNPEWRPKDVEVAVLVQHLSAIITSRCLTGKSKNPVACCLLEPAIMNNSFILAAPPAGSGYSCYEYFETIQRENVFLFLCSTCGTRFTAREKEFALKCPNCTSSCEIKQIKHNKFSLKAEKGYLYCEPQSMHDEMLCVRNLNPIEFRILHLIIHAALFAGYSLDLTTKELAEFMKVENPSEVCFQYIQIDLNVLSAIMCCTKEKIIVLLHQVLEEATSLLTEDSTLPLPHDEEMRLSWESYFSQLVRPFVQKFRENRLKPPSKNHEAENKDKNDGNDKDPESGIKELKPPSKNPEAENKDKNDGNDKDPESGIKELKAPSKIPEAENKDTNDGNDKDTESGIKELKPPSKNPEAENKDKNDGNDKDPESGIKELEGPKNLEAENKDENKSKQHKFLESQIEELEELKEPEAENKDENESKQHKFLESQTEELEELKEPEAENKDENESKHKFLESQIEELEELKELEVENKDENESKHKFLEPQIDELEEPNPNIETRNASLPRLFRMKHLNSFAKLREFYLNSSEKVKENHQLLGLFLDYHRSLSHIRNFVALNAWSRRVDVLLSRSLTRAEAREKMINDAVISKEIERLRIGKESSQENPVIQAFQNFRKAWDDVVPLFNKNLGGNEHITKMSPVGLCLVERQDLGQYLCATLVSLAELQNEFLDKCLAIATSGKCPALQFLAKRGSKCSFPSVHVQDAKEKEIIRYEWTDRFLDHSRHHLEYGRGTEIIYDLAKIEKELAGSFLLGKAYLKTSKGLREFVFSKQLFHDCANILNELDQVIPQNELPKDVERELSSMADKKLNDMQVLLQHMEIVLCFVKRTGGHPDDELLDYVEQLMTESRPFPKDLLPKTQGGIRLKHVCALYEFLEDKLAVSAPDLVRPGYKHAIPENAKSQLKKPEVLKENETLLDATATAIRRFIFRYLNMEQPPDADHRLVEFMQDPSLWPINIRSEHAYSEFRVSNDVPALFPKMLTIAHTYEVHKYYHDLYKELMDKKKPLHQTRRKGPSRKAGRLRGGYA